MGKRGIWHKTLQNDPRPLFFPEGELNRKLSLGVFFVDTALISLVLALGRLSQGTTYSLSWIHLITVILISFATRFVQLKIAVYATAFFVLFGALQVLGSAQWPNPIPQSALDRHLELMRLVYCGMVVLAVAILQKLTNKWTAVNPKYKKDNERIASG